jgi:GR25 family glycosyltransferase involved in LPS biosynthesis
MVNMLIFGFPHCGTTVLRAIFGNNDTIYEYPEETQTIPSVINNAMNKEHIIIKWPWTCEKFFKKEYDEYIKLFIIRNPYYVFSSLNERFDSIPTHNRIDKYLDTANLFIKYKDSNTKNLYCIKYEEIFANDFRIIKDILNKHNIAYNDTMFINNKPHYITNNKIDINNLSINPKHHLQYRTYQINSPFIYNDNINKLNLNQKQEDILNNSKILKKLKYYNPKDTVSNNLEYNTSIYSISKIYVIHLTESLEREIHIKNEFKMKNIENYDFFEAITWDSIEVKEKFSSGFVKISGCFRCNSNNCDHKNKILSKRQIGNWCSFINLMKKIAEEKNSDLIMICEDDIKFADNYSTIIEQLINKDTFLKYRIDIDKPLLIRLGGITFNPTIHPNMTKVVLSKKKVLSNPCFMINYKFAESFLTNLKEINTTSDIFIHKVLVNIDTTIQHFTLIPQLGHELSYGPNAVFKSTVRV